MNEEPELQIVRKHGASLTLSTTQSSLAARGRRDAANLFPAENPLSEAYRLAELGDTDIQYCLGRAHTYGRAYPNHEHLGEIVAPQNEAEAMKWFRRAAEAGHIGSAYFLGLLLYDRASLPSEYAEATKWLRRGSAPYGENFGIREACLANCCLAGLTGEQDYAEALQWLLAALHCEIGGNTAGDVHTLLAYLTALPLLNPEYSPVVVEHWRLEADDLAEDVEIDHKYADEGNAYYQFCLGLVYAFGRGVSKDHIQAAKWFRQAAEAGNSDAQFQLGLLYAYGHGVEQDYLQAHMWCDLASSNSNTGNVFSSVRDVIASKTTARDVAQRRMSIE